MRKATTLLVVVEYDEALTDPDVIASYLDLVLDAAHSSLDQCGPLTFSEVRIDHESDGATRRA